MWNYVCFLKTFCFFEVNKKYEEIFSSENKSECNDIKRYWRKRDEENMRYSENKKWGFQLKFYCISWILSLCKHLGEEIFVELQRFWTDQNFNYEVSKQYLDLTRGKIGIYKLQRTLWKDFLKTFADNLLYSENFLANDLNVVLLWDLEQELIRKNQRLFK